MSSENLPSKTLPKKVVSLKKTVLAVFIGSLLSGCIELGVNDSSDDEVQDDQPQEEQRVSITGFAVKGILAGAIVEAFDITGATKLAETVTDANGKYTLPLIDHDGPILVKLKTQASTQATCDSAVGCDDGSGTPVPFGSTYSFNDAEFDLSAVLPSATEAAEQELMVTPVTHMAAARVQAAVADGGGVITPAEVEGLNRATATLLGLDGIDINKVAPVDITDAAATNEGSAAAQLYGTLVASIQTLAEKDPEASIAEVIDDLAEDYAETGGLVSNSATEETITLEEIFTEAIEVVAAAEEKAAEEGVEVDLDAAETQLDSEQAEAENAEPDVVVEVEPEVVIPEEELTQAQATQLGIDLLLDLNDWEDALTAEQNQTLSQPFFDQLEGTDAILESIDDQSSLMRGFAKLVGEEHEVEECYYWDMAGNCLGYETYSEFEGGPVLEVVGVFGALTKLASEIQSTPGIVSGSFDYPAQIDSQNPDSIIIEDLTDIISEEDDASGISTIVYGLDATFTITEGKIETITFVMDSAEADYPNSFSITMTQSDFDDESNQIAFGISASSIDLVTENIALSIPQGSAEDPKGVASMTFATAADRKAFSSSELDDPSLAKLTAIDVHFESEGVLSGATTEAGAAIPDTTASISIDFDYNYNAAAEADVANTETSLVLSIAATNTANEEIQGEFAVMVKGDFSEEEVAETAVEPAYFDQTLDLSDAEVKFVGKVVNTATDATGAAQKAEFNGSIVAGFDFFSPAVAAGDDEQLVERAVANLDGSILVSTTPSGGEKSSVGFVGSAEVTLALVKTPEGIPFKLHDEEQFHVEKVKLFGRISADQDIDAEGIADRSASLAINAVLNADIAGLVYNPVDLPLNGEVLAQLKYGIRSIDANSAESYIGRFQAIEDAKAALLADGVDAHVDHQPVDDKLASFTRANCYTPTVGLYELCDVTSTENFMVHEWFPTALTEAEAIAQAEERFSGQHTPYENHPLPVVETLLTVSGGGAVFDHANCADDLGTNLIANCPVSRTYTATTSFPADVVGDYDREHFLRGIDAQLLDHNSLTFAVANCVADAVDAGIQNCELTRTENFHNYFGDNANAQDVQLQLESSNPGFSFSNVICEHGGCNYDRSEMSVAAFNSALTPDSIAVIELGKNSYNSYSYQVEAGCATATCAVTLQSFSDVGLPAGLSNAERETYFTDIENGYVTRTSTLTVDMCETHDDGSMHCKFNQTLTHVHNSVMNDLTNGLTKFIAAIASGVTNNGHDINLHVWMDSQFGEFVLMTSYGAAETNFTGDIGPGESDEKMLPVTLDYFEPEFDPERLAAGEGAFVQVSANVTIKADLTGLEDAEISVFVNRLGEEDAAGRIKLTNGDRVVELNIDSTEMLTNGTVNNLTIRNADAEMSLVLTCATDTNGEGVHDNDLIAACDDGINMQGDIFVGGFKVADLEDRDGLPVFNFDDGSGYDLILTPNFIVQPSAP